MSDTAFTLMMDPINSCPLSCAYCYAQGRHRQTMTHDLMARAFECVAAYLENAEFREIHILWHGGEPLLAGPDFFRNAVDTAASFFSKIPCRHFVQTSGLTVDESICDALMEKGIEVGVSLDGPEEVHDRLRRFPDGSGSWRRVMDRIEFLQKSGMAFGFCMTVTTASKDRASEIYRFFNSLGHPLRMNPVLPLPGNGASKSFALKPGDYGEFACAIFDLWIQTRLGRIPISPLDQYLGAILGQEITDCRHRANCVGTCLAVRADGKIALCSPFDMHLPGHVSDTRLKEVFTSELSRDLKPRERGPAMCRQCGDYAICHGGCPLSTRAAGLKSWARDPLCPDYRRIFAHLRQTLQLDKHPPKGRHV